MSHRLPASQLKQAGRLAVCSAQHDPLSLATGMAPPYRSRFRANPRLADRPLWLGCVRVNDRAHPPFGRSRIQGPRTHRGAVAGAGVNIDADNGGGMTSIMFTAMFGRTGIPALLKTHGASACQQSGGCGYPDSWDGCCAFDASACGLLDLVALTQEKPGRAGQFQNAKARARRAFKHGCGARIRRVPCTCRSVYPP